MRTVDIAFLGCLLLVLLGAVTVGVALRVASLEPTPVPYATPTPRAVQ